MAMYAVTVQPPSDTQQAIVGDFAGNGRQQILTANGSRLAILEVSRIHKGFKQTHVHDVFGIIRQIASFRLAGATKDLIIVSSDSGRIITLEYIPDGEEDLLNGEKKHVVKHFKTIHFETFGKSGVRRVIPGQYLAADPKGRAAMVASVEKNKIVYILNRNAQRDLTISSPLEAHKPQTLVYSVCALDVGYDNPLFAVLEVDFSDADSDPTGRAVEQIEKELVYYELDLGLNHVVRKWSEKVDRTSNILFRVPGGTNGPSGVLCCGEESISYRRIYNHPKDVLRLPIPRRSTAIEDPNRKRCIVSGTMYTLKAGGFFYILQTEDGDVFKITFPAEEDKKTKGVSQIKIQYFDTIPLATSICILRSGFLYCACESGDRLLYELEQLGDDNETAFYSDQYPADPHESYTPAFFHPRPLKNLTAVERIASMNPIMDMQVANLTQEDAPQVYSICGSGAQSTFRTAKHALEVLDLVESQLPQRAVSVWTTKKTVDDNHDSYIVLSLLTHTLVLQIGEDVEEARDSGFLNETVTLGVQQFGEDCLLQIYPKGIRHISPGIDESSHGAVTDWPTPPHRTIVACATNNRQVAIALSSGEIYYFECDSDGALAKADAEVSLNSTVTCLAIADVPHGHRRSGFLAVACDDQTVRIFTLFPDDDGEILKQQSMQALSATPSALCISHMKDRSERGESLYLHVGLSSGVYIRTIMDEDTGSLSETRRRFLGTVPIKFARVVVGDDPAILVLTSRPWLGYTDPYNSTLALTPLNYIPFESAGSFESEQFKGIICVRGEDLRIFTLDNLATNLYQESIQLQHTPRKFAGHPEQPLYYIIESDNNTVSSHDRELLKAEARKVKDEDGDMKPEINGDMTNGNHENEDLSPQQFGYPRARGRWASCIQVVDPVNRKEVIHTTELEENQCAVSLALVSFESRDSETFLAVGVAKDLTFTPYEYANGGILLYRLLNNGQGLEFYHKTDLPAPPLALLGFRGKLAVGVGKDLALYDCGQKSLLRKAQTSGCTATRITGLKTQGSRLIVSDQAQSVTYVVHKDAVHPNRLIPFVDDSVSRWTTCAEMVDYETVAAGDKFGNIWMVRCPAKVSEAADESLDGQHLVQDKPYLGGAPNRLDLIMHYFTNDIPMAVQKTPLIPGGDKVLFWAGLQGTLGAMIPLESRKDFKLFQQLELILRSEDKPLAGRDHLAFRSYYSPVKNVIDGDLVERFLVLNKAKRESVANQLDGSWSVSDVESKIWNMRGLWAF
ncbi:hypothetical protein K469DRAFT_546523 [Zopfia rhizophila CBS 207.26]|uniref:Pre-mRNA-splicing factor rse1 n=1 Tax=Zopfia rhizophila CBS 207.26 TaxID=1314779 RepID=A0A6A6ERS6_9PEZI|nr:hypothetical protein K469DRAFT_546523 [Zopfia rhizophila CBS 207.26]